MFIKHLVCKTTHRTRFAEGQAAWRQLSEVPGFIGRLGGWSVSNDHEAVILSLWQDEDTYLAFMTGQHDGLYADSGHAAVMGSVQTECYRQVMTIPGRDSDLDALVSRLVAGDGESGTYMRMVESTLHPEACDRFQEAQHELWNPALASSGVLTGTFGMSIEDATRFLTVSVWPSAAVHDVYNRTVVPQLMREADVIGNCRAITGRLVTVEPFWSV